VLAGVASVVNSIGNSTLDALWELLLKLLGYIGSLAVILSMGLVGRLTRLRTGRVNLHLRMNTIKMMGVKKTIPSQEDLSQAFRGRHVGCLQGLLSLQ
jgi:hypothetical protein